jgi:hypothetical protein
MTTAQTVFEYAIALMDELNDQGAADTTDTKEYKDRTLPILNVLIGELYKYSDTFELGDEGERPIVSAITNFRSAIGLDDYICRSVLPYGLAAHLLMAEDPNTASFCNQRYEELKAGLGEGIPASSVDITDVYGRRGGVDPYNEFGMWS